MKSVANNAVRQEMKVVYNRERHVWLHVVPHPYAVHFHNNQQQEKTTWLK